MNTFLPASYRFTPSKLLDASSKYNLMHPMNSIRVWGCSIFTICLLLMIGIFIYLQKKEDSLTNTQVTHYMTLMLVPTIGALVSLCIIIVFQPEPCASYVAERFKYTDKSNLAIKMLDNGSRPTKIDDHKPYPYQLYYHSNNKYVYLGTMKNGKFTPGNEDPAPVFYKYYQYVQEHKLANKFKHDATLKRDGRYLTRNGKAQWILTNNKDVTLHLVDNTKVKQTNVVKN